MSIQIEFDVLTVCRICLQGAADDQDEMVSIFLRDSESKCLISEKIEKCSGIKILNDPDLPTQICTNCRAFLEVSYKFRVICENSDNYLREFVCKTRVYDDYENGIPEYLTEYDDTTNDHQTKQREQDEESQRQQQTMTDIENGADMEMVDYELWPCVEDAEEAGVEAEAEDNDAEDDVFGEDLSSQETSLSPSKTLDISADGAAVIRVVNSEPLGESKPKQLHICDICGNTYPRKYALDAHMRRHRNERPYECEICNQRFHLNFQLTRHIRRHIGLRPYTCQYCNRNFSDRSTMVKHERIHRNERPYSCFTCGKTFTYSSVLKVHMLTHTGEKPFHCELCGKRFARSHHLRAHLDTLLHQNDPRAKILLQRIHRDEDDEAADTGKGQYPSV